MQADAERRVALIAIRLTALVGLTLAAGCAKPSADTRAVEKGWTDTQLPTAEVMAHVVNPAAYQFWGGAGVSLTLAGEKDLSPKTEKEWDVVENGATTVLVASNTLLLPGYRRAPEGDWIAHVRELQAVSIEARQAAERHNTARMWTLGARLDAACDACHAEFVRPSGAVAKAAPPETSKR